MARAEVCWIFESFEAAPKRCSARSLPANTDILVETVIYCAHDPKIRFKSATKGLARTTLGTCSSCSYSWAGACGIV
jgi:hypothetical protein